MVDEQQRELLARIAAKYYEQYKSQNEIADEMGLSRVKMYRLLKEARQENVVKVESQYRFIRSVSEDLPASPSLADGQHIQEVMEAAVISSDESRWVNLAEFRELRNLATISKNRDKILSRSL